MVSIPITPGKTDACFNHRSNVGSGTTKSIPQFEDLSGDRLSDLDDADLIELQKAVAGCRTGIKIQDAIHHPVERPVGMPEDEAIQAPEFLLHRLIQP